MTAINRVNSIISNLKYKIAHSVDPNKKLTQTKSPGEGAFGDRIGFYSEIGRQRSHCRLGVRSQYRPHYCVRWLAVKLRWGFSREFHRQQFRRLFALAAFPTAFATYLSHVFPIFADGFAPFLTSLSGFFRGEFVCSSFLVGSFSAFAGDRALFFCVHRCESAFALFSHDTVSLFGSDF